MPSAALPLISPRGGVAAGGVLAMVLLAMVLALSAMPIILTRALERRLHAAATAADGVAPLAAGLRDKVRFIMMPGTHVKISEEVKTLRRSESFLLHF